MVRGLIVIILSLCILSAITFRAEAQENPPSGNLKIAQIEQLKKEMKELQQRLDPLRLQMQQLVSQVNIVRSQMQPIEDKLKDDFEQMQVLIKDSNFGHNQGSQGQGQHPS
jgi:peptidoglycan hydrolase CwlO-like protein